MGTGRRSFDLDEFMERLLEDAPAAPGRGGASGTSPDPALPGASEVRLSPEVREAARRAAREETGGVFPAIYKHPLTAARASLGLSAPQYLKRLNRIHQELGFGVMACRPEKASRWESNVWSPERTAQVAIATLHQVPYELLDEFPWPQWLLHAFPDDGSVLSTPWTPGGTVAAMASCVRGGAVDRRGFLIATGTTLGAVAADWSGALGGPSLAAVDGSAAEALSAAAQGRARRLTLDMVAAIEQRLDALRRLDDVMGGGELCHAARIEFDLVTHLAEEASYDEKTGRRLFSAVAEAGRLCGWVHYDHGLNAAAQKYFITALRASATAGDAPVGVGILSCMAHQVGSIGNPQDAVTLMQTAQEQVRNRATPRVRAILHVRTARSLARTPYGRYATARELEKARDAWSKGPHDDDPPWTYWLTAGDIELAAGSAALTLGNPRRALGFFEAARFTDYSADTHARDHAVYLVRLAEAHLALGEVEEACGAAQQAFLQGKQVNSARQSDALADFRTRLKAAHGDSRAAKEFLELTAQV